MSEDILLRHTVNKPGTSCLGCRRRKLKCSRESEGCLNCTKSDLPCVYPTPDTSVKRKRGPYKKDKPPRQRHLEDLVKYLEPKSHSPDQVDRDGSESPAASSSGNSGLVASSKPSTAKPPAANAANSEDLVKDALIALTKSSVSDHDSKYDDGSWQNYARSGPAAASGGHHPPVRRIFEFWNIFVSRVDPIVKIIHCPTFSKKLFSAVDNLGSIPPATEAMMFAIYYSALSTCSAREARTRFGEAQDVLLHRYGRNIEAAIGDNYDVPALEALQALVLYIICIRRADNGTNLRALFSLAVRSAQLGSLHQDPEGKYSPLEAELRRRLWYHLCGLESRTAEEGASRSASIFQDGNVRLPSNLNDGDLDLRTTKPPQSRVGVTDMSFPLLRFEIHRLIFDLFAIKRDRAASWQQQEPSGQYGLAEHQNDFLEKAKARLKHLYLDYMHDSRPYDWLCSNFVEGMLTKARVIIDFPFGATPTKNMPMDERMKLLHASVHIIQKTHGMAVDERIKDMSWYFRGYVQWHSLAIVVAELGWSKNTEFANNAWAVLDPILADWDRVYKTKRDEPAWDHVNQLIERARYLRQQRRAHAAARRQSSHKKVRAEPSEQSRQAPIPNVEHVQQSYQHPTQNQQTPIMCSQPATFGQYVATPSQASVNSHPTPESHDSGTCTGPGSVMDFDVDFDVMAGLENVDFSAFDAVFNDGSWNNMLDSFDETGMGMVVPEGANYGSQNPGWWSQGSMIQGGAPVNTVPGYRNAG